MSQTHAPQRLLGTDRVRLPLVVIEALRTTPVERAVFSHATMVGVTHGRAVVQTPAGHDEIAAGDLMVAGAGVWVSVHPEPTLRTWTIYADECFLRAMASWLLPPPDRLRSCAHPADWDGAPVILRPGSDVLDAIEPIVRRMSLISWADDTDLAASRLLGLFVSVAGALIPGLTGPTTDGHAVTTAVERSPVLGRMNRGTTNASVSDAVRLLHDRMAEPWTMARLAAHAAVSPQHLTRLFTAQTGISPMRYLTQIRLTEFTRLIEETDLSIAAAARLVGWNDSRVATAWFRRRYSTTPLQFRRSTHPSCHGRPPCAHCRGLCPRSQEQNEPACESGRNGP